MERRGAGALAFVDGGAAERIRHPRVRRDERFATAEAV